jgi:hypothetical protein
MAALNVLEQRRADVRSFLRARGIVVPGEAGGPLPGLKALTELVHDRADEKGWSAKTRRRNVAALKALLGQIAGVRREAAAFMSADHSLEKMNHWLTSLGEAPQPSKTQARHVLRTVHICIYDLMAGLFDRRFDTVAKLGRYCNSTDQVYPKADAKAHPDRIKVFLRRIGPYLRHGRGGAYTACA